MANTTITNLPTVTSLNGTEPLLGVQSGSSVQITTGQIVSLATGGGGVSPLPVIAGGTGDTTLTAYGLMYGNGTDPVGAVTPPAGTDYVLVASAGSAPTWQPTIPVTAGVDSVSFGTTGLTPSTATAGVITVAGTLVAANGGTGQSSYTIGDLLYASSSTALSKLADVATGSILISGGVGVAPSYSSSPTLTTSLTTPLVLGGTGVASTLTLQSTSGAGTTDSIAFKVGNNGATTAMTVNTSGNVGIGTTSLTNINLRVSNNITGSTAAYGVYEDGAVQSDVTSTASYYVTSANMPSGTLTNLNHFQATQGAIAATVTAQNGFLAAGTLTGATNNYGFLANNTAGVTAGKTAYAFYSAVNTATGGGTTYQFYAAGTAPSVINGTVTLGTPLAVSSGGTGQAAALTQYGVVYGASTTAMGITAAGTTGQVLVATTSGAPSWSASPTLTSLTTPLVIGGTAASSTLTLESTSGAGTTDSIIFKTGNQSTRMTIDTSGYVGIGSSGTTTGVNLITNANITGATSSYAHQNSGTVQSGVTTLASAYYSNIALAAASFTTTSVAHFYASPAAGGAGSTITNQYGFVAGPAIGTQGAATITNAYGFYGSIAAATNNYNLYMAGTANNYMAGNLGIGNTGSLSANNLVVGANITGGTGGCAILLNGVVQSGVTSAAYGVQSNISSAAASFTTTNVSHFYANPATGGAGSTITNQFGFNAESTLATAGAATITNVYGFYGAIASGTNRYNLYMNGTAVNYFNGTIIRAQAAPTAQAAASTATGAAMLSGLLNYTGAVGVLNLPTGTNMDTALAGGGAPNDASFDVSVINTGTGVATVTAATGFTIVGLATVTNGTSGLFRARKTAANTFVLYRMS